MRQARSDAGVYLNQIEWEQVYDFCERLYGRLACDSSSWQGETEVEITKAEAQLFLAEELQRLFDEERLGYEFRDGFVQRRGRHTTSQIIKVEKALADHRLNSARIHFQKALRHFRNRKEPDLENAVKEAVCAVEAAAKELFPEAKAKTLGDFANWATGSVRSLLPS